MTQNPFRKKIRAAIANETLQAALDANAERRAKAREESYASLAEPRQTLRERAHQVRADVIAHLDEYLEQFISQVKANGITVHHAEDAAQARQIVLDIAQQRGAKLVAKSKSMVSEEMALNPALEAAGIEVVETDLGEYIVQLRGEPPAHIITPAVHLTRGQVGETFHEKLGIPYTDDVSALTAAARRKLRKTFLEADIGITGVNFGVVESGSLCVLTNEGNGRMVTSVPPVHIALMGQERLVPTFNDLSLMLQLLPRSATGQKITVYTQLIHKARQEGETDGAQERHLIILNNGRSRVRRSPLADVLMCVRCGACINVCPIFREIGGHSYLSADGENTPYPGPIGSVVSPGLFGQAAFGHLAQACTLCGACYEECPMAIDLPTLLLRVRGGRGAENQEIKEQENRESGNGEGTGLPWATKMGLRLFTWVSVKPWRFKMAQKLAALFGRVAAPQSEWMKLPAFTGWGLSKDLPRPAVAPFSVLGTREQGLGIGEQGLGTRNLGLGIRASGLGTGEQGLVKRFQEELAALEGVFVPCTVDTLAAEIISLLKERGIAEIMAWDAERLPLGMGDALRAAGIEVTSEVNPSVRAGLTGALGGIAETGTLVITSGEGRPLTHSLLPEIHLAILRVQDIVSTLSEAVTRSEVKTASSVALISGPSRTADIEMTLSIGVHGPKEVIVFGVW